MNSHLSVIPVIGFAAYSGTGKTTLIEQLIPALNAKGLKIALIKHAHHAFDIDKEGKDTFRFRQAGAQQILISSRYRQAWIKETPEQETSLQRLIEMIHSPEIDLILVEGFKKEAFPKIELKRDAIQKPWLFPNDSQIIAIASDLPQSQLPQNHLPKLDINDPDAICHFLCDWLQLNIHSAPKSTRLSQPQNKLKQQSGASCDDFSDPMLSVKQAQQKILANIPIVQQHLPCKLAKLHNAVLGEDIIAPVNVPAANNSAMDGYAIRSEDLHQTQFVLIGNICAGDISHTPLTLGECMGIMTGAPLPPHADTVIIKEQTTEIAPKTIQINQNQGQIQKGQNVRLMGEDLKQGTCIFQKGKRLKAAEIGMLASLGFQKINIYRPLKVAIFSNGNEVIAQGEHKTNEKIYDTNRFTLHALLNRLNCQIIDFGILPDDQAQIVKTLEKASKQADLIMTSGGVSVGQADFIKSALSQLGKIQFWRVHMRPGRPLAFGIIQDTPFFGLPGNPVAVMVTFLLFVEPAIRQAQGEVNWHRTTLMAQAEMELRSRLGRTEYIRAIYQYNDQAQLTVKSTGSQGSGILRSMSEANCLIEIPPETAHINIGEIVKIIPLHD